MNVLIVSDSHGLTWEIEEITNRHKGKVDLYIHCGDSEIARENSVLAPFKVVKGNCDFDSSLPNEITENINGHTIYITHGHLYNVKSTLMSLKYRALEANATIVCFGHSHIAGAELIDKVLFINPGSIRLPVIRRQKTYAILNIEKGIATITFYELGGSEVPELSQQFTLIS